jgi:hypothetical protein
VGRDEILRGGSPPQGRLAIGPQVRNPPHGLKDANIAGRAAPARHQQDPGRRVKPLLITQRPGRSEEERLVARQAIHPAPGQSEVP